MSDPITEPGRPDPRIVAALTRHRSVGVAALALDVSRGTLSRLLNGRYSSWWRTLKERWSKQKQAQRRARWRARKTAGGSGQATGSGGANM